MRDFAPDFDWEDAYRDVQQKSLNLDVDEPYAHLYSALVAYFDNEEKAQVFLKNNFSITGLQFVAQNVGQYEAQYGDHVYCVFPCALNDVIINKVIDHDFDQIVLSYQNSNDSYSDFTF